MVVETATIAITDLPPSAKLAQVDLMDHGPYGLARSCGTPDSLLLTHGLLPTTGQRGWRYTTHSWLRAAVSDLSIEYGLLYGNGNVMINVLYFDAHRHKLVNSDDSRVL